MILTFLKEQCRLAAPLPLLVALAFGVLWLWRRPASAWPRRYLTALALGAFIVTTPFGAMLLVRGLAHGLTPITSAGEARGADVVVVLGGGAATATVGGQTAGVLTFGSLLRALEGARVFKLIGARLAIASGGIASPERQTRPESVMIRDVLIGAGVPASAIVEESRSRTTREQAQRVAAMLVPSGERRVVLITSPTHMRRSLQVFRAEGLDPIPSLAPLRSEQVPASPLFLPSSEGLALADTAVYDYAASTYYLLRGWAPWR